MKPKAIEPTERVLGSILVLDDSLQINKLTDKFCSNFNVTREALLGKRIDEVFSPRDRKGTIDFYNQVNQYKSGLVDVVVTLVIGGDERLVRLRMRKAGRKWIVLFEDMLAEPGDLFHQLHLGKERWTSIVRNLSDGIAMLDTQGRIVEFNSMFLELMRFRSRHGVPLNEDAVYKRNIFELLDAKTGSELQANFDKARSKKGVKYTSEAIRDQHYLSIEVTPINLPVRGFIGCSLIVKDVSDSKQVEKLIVDLDAYAHTVAHDLRNPLSVIVGCVDYLQQANADELTDKVSEKLAVIKQVSWKMTSIIDALLLLASVRNTKIIDYTALDMAQIVDGALTRLAGPIEDYNADIVLPDEWPESVGYAPWVEEIWMNYIGNALKYSGKPPAIKLGYTPVPGAMQFWVQDNGKGLDAAERSAIFAEFARLDRDRHIDGYGLGLSIVQNIIDKMGGDVGVESELNSGSRFYFTLAVCE